MKKKKKKKPFKSLPHGIAALAPWAVDSVYLISQSFEYILKYFERNRSNI